MNRTILCFLTVMAALAIVPPEEVTQLTPEFWLLASLTVYPQMAQTGADFVNHGWTRTNTDI